MSIHRPLIGFSLFTIVSLLVTWIMWITLQRSVPGTTTSYHATFSNVLGLFTGDDVRIAGVRVGRVSAIGLDEHNHAQVTFEVQSDQPLYADTRALVRYQNLIGQRYLALQEGTVASGVADMIPPGGTIPLSHTEPSFDISLLLGGFQPLFQMLHPGQVNELSEALIQALQGDGVSLAVFVTQAAAVANEFTDNNRHIGALLQQVSMTSTALHDYADTSTDRLRGVLDHTTSLMKGLNQTGDNLAATLDELHTGYPKILASMRGNTLSVATTINYLSISGLYDPGSRLMPGIRDMVDMMGSMADVLRHVYGRFTSPPDRNYDPTNPNGTAGTQQQRPAQPGGRLR